MSLRDPVSVGLGPDWPGPNVLPARSSMSQHRRNQKRSWVIKLRVVPVTWHLSHPVTVSCDLQSKSCMKNRMSWMCSIPQPTWQVNWVRSSFPPAFGPDASSLFLSLTLSCEKLKTFRFNKFKESKIKKYEENYIPR